VFALFAFIVYYNLLNLGQSWIGSGRTSFTGFLLAAWWRPAAGPAVAGQAAQQLDLAPAATRPVRPEARA
jgi:hypothetical protein